MAHPLCELESFCGVHPERMRNCLHRLSLSLHRDYLCVFLCQTEFKIITYVFIKCPAFIINLFRYGGPFMWYSRHLS